MKHFDSILNWKLLAGSHPFPGPDGGTCVNEAAIIAAGFEYKAVSTAADCPPCFSRVLAQYAIHLNDRLPDSQRQELLMPFVVRLAGTADTDEIERQRFEFIVIGLVREIVTIPLRGWMDESANELEAVTTVNEAIVALRKFGSALALADADARALADADALALALALADADTLALALALALADADADAFANALEHRINIASVHLLDSAMKIGKQADPIESALVADRLESARAKAIAETQKAARLPERHGG